MAHTVKTREHHGADSFDLTVPVELVREHDINKGDIFEVEAETEDGEVVLTYRRVYES
jgi:bifunctional DNA-binding transcriptional regulator/antitoxin component of YhaV-PrlF toxin-antitoxin module